MSAKLKSRVVQVTVVVAASLMPLGVQARAPDQDAPDALGFCDTESFLAGQGKCDPKQEFCDDVGGACEYRDGIGYHCQSGVSKESCYLHYCNNTSAYWMMWHRGARCKEEKP